MANFTVRNIPDELLNKIRLLSIIEKRSLNSEILMVLEKGVSKESDSVKYVKPWLAKAQIYTGEVTAGIMAVLGIYTLVSFFSRLTEYQLPHWSSNTSWFSLLGTVVTTVLSVNYFSAIRKRKVKTVQSVYRNGLLFPGKVGLLKESEFVFALMPLKHYY